MKAMFLTAAYLAAGLALMFNLTVMADPGNPAPANVGVYNFSTWSATAATAGTPMLPRNSKRDLLIIQNTGGGNVTLRPNASVVNLQQGLILGAGSTFMPIPAMVDQWYADSWSGTVTLTIIEGIR